MAKNVADVQNDSESDSDSIVRPSIYPQGRHLPKERPAVLEEYYGGKVAELELLTELKSHRLVRWRCNIIPFM